MKLRNINQLASLTLGITIALTGCSKDDGAIPNRISIEDVPAISTNLESGGTAANITFANQAAFEGKFKETLYFTNATPPDKIDIAVRKNNSNLNVKIFKTNVTSLPASFTVTAADIATLFGTALALNDTYDFAPDIYVGTKKYEAFPGSGIGAGQGITGMSNIGYGEYVRFSVK